MMRVSPRWWKWLAASAAVVAFVLIVAWTWVIPAIIVGRIRAAYGGHVRIGGWWVDGSSAGVSGLVLHEGTDSGSPVMARADRVVTDLSWRTLLRGRLMPGTIRLDGPEVTLRVGRDGGLLTRLPTAEGSATPDRLPIVVVQGGRLTFEQAGRRSMIVSGLGARLEPGPEGATLMAEADDPTWGRLRGQGRLANDLDTVDVKLWSESLVADPEKARRIPFVPEATWDHVLPTGAVGVVLTIRKAAGTTRPVDVNTVVTYDRTHLDLPTLGLATEGTTGRMIVHEGVVQLEAMRGEAIGGGVSADGTLDFRREPPRIDLDLGLDGVDVTQAPASWQLREAGLTGRLTGRVDLVVDLTDAGADLSGTSGAGTLTDGTVGDIPFKSLKLSMRAEGTDLRYESGLDDAAGLGRWALLPLIALQAPPTAAQTGEPAQDPPAPGRGGFILPRAISTEVEFEDVDLTQILARADALGVHLPFVLAGRLSLKARATIPLGTLRDVSAYAFHGEATLEAAHVAGVDLGRLTARLALEEGVLELSQLKGQFVDMPAGGLTNRPAPTAEIPDQGPLPPGGFRGRLRAELSPPGRLEARLEGDALPLGELAAPALPRPTPLGGLVDVVLDIGGGLEHASDPRAWTLEGRIASRRITYREATLDAVAADLALREGRFEVAELSATLAGRPLAVRAGIALEAPYPFEATLDVRGWDLARLLALVPGVPRPSPVDGLMTAEASASGTVEPLRVTSRGGGTLARFRTGPVTWGDVPVRWETGEEAIVVSIVEARPFGGTLAAEARIPVRGDAPITGSATLSEIDTAQLARALPGDALQLSGRAGGRLGFTLRPLATGDAAPIEADVRLDAPDLAVQGIPASGVQAALAVHRGVLSYDLYAESLGGRFKFKGEVPLRAEPGDAGPGAEAGARASGRLQAIGFRLDDGLWRALGLTAAAGLAGEGAVDANVRLGPGGSPLARGVAEFRDLRWGPGVPIGRLRGEFALAPGGWRVGPLTGEVLGGAASGELASGTLDDPGEGARGMRFRLELDRASLARAAAVAPGLAGLLEGDARVRLAGRLDAALRANGEVLVPNGRLAGLPLRELRAPVELTLIPGSASGSLESRRWTTRLAGGHVQGDALVRFGSSRAFQADLRLADLDLEAVARAYTDQSRPASGKVSGAVTLRGQDTARPETYRGRAELDLADAAVLDLPVFRALDRFLGGPAGGVFEEGHVSAGIGNRQVQVEDLRLLGRVAQLHARGTVGFNTDLDLIVLINTNQIIPQTGQALLGLIPGLDNVRGGEATLRVANFLSNRLIKLRVGGTLRSPTVALDPTATVSNAAVGFFAGALKLPLGLLK